MSSWDWVGMYFKMAGMDPNRYAASCIHPKRVAMALWRILGVSMVYN